MAPARTPRAIAAALVLGAVIAAPAAAGKGPEAELSGFVAADLRAFPVAPLHAGQTGARINPSLVIEPELTLEWGGGRDRLTAVPFARLDAQDKDRTHFDLREFKWLHVGDGWDMRVGIDKVFWGVTEARHLVNIINQTDAVEDIDEEDKLGQPMINLGLQRDWGNLNLFIMSGFRDRTFPGTRGRLRGAMPVDNDKSVFHGDAGRAHPDAALRYMTVIGDWDIGVAHFHGVGREPRLVAGTNSSGGATLIPHYDIIDQSSIDLQVTKGAWLWKLEAIGRSGQGDTFAATSAGFEYTWFGSNGSPADIGLLLEYHYDGRDRDAPPTSFEDDFFIGVRYTFNDAEDTDLLAGVVIDRLNGGSFFNVEADTRLNDHWTVEVEGRAFAGIADNDINFGSRRDHHVQLRLARYF
jgi:hypothetical protein